MKKWEPQSYDRSVLQYRTATTMLQDFSFTGNESVLDIGSGTGNISDSIFQRIPNGRFVGIDISRDMVEFAQKKYSNPRLSFVEQDVLKMNYQSCFDVIVSFWTLSWVANQALAIKNIATALKPGGRLLLMYPLRHDAYDVADQMIKLPKWKKYFENAYSPRPFITEPEYRRIIHATPEAVMRVERKEIPCHFDNKAQMQASIKSWMSYLDNLREDNVKQEFLDEFTERYARHRNISTCTMYFTILEIRGFKPMLDQHLENQPAKHSEIRAKL